ncbi:membrane protein [Marinosulfonomonas sp. PRT-SC04]|nr:membrane protein [Marinosulfonomonas sp. PRT-SC04]
MTDSHIWITIGLVALGTYLIRFSFIGLIGGRELPTWVLRHLRYTPVAVLPGLVAPLVLWPDATGGAYDAPRLMAAAVTVLLGMVFKNMMLAIFGGGVTLFLMLMLVG